MNPNTIVAQIAIKSARFLTSREGGFVATAKTATQTAMVPATQTATFAANHFAKMRKSFMCSSRRPHRQPFDHFAVSDVVVLNHGRKRASRVLGVHNRNVLSAASPNDGDGLARQFFGHSKIRAGPTLIESLAMLLGRGRVVFVVRF
jgi:hypothetical protein